MISLHRRSPDFLDVSIKTDKDQERADCLTVSVLDSKSMFTCAVFMQAVKSTNVSHLNMMFLIIPADP